MRKWFRFRPGVTSTELLVVLGIFGVLTTGVLSLFSTSMGQWTRGSSKSEADDIASVSLQRIVRAIEDGKTATSTIGGLSVRLPGVNDQGDYDRSTNGDLVLLYLSGGKVYKRVNSGTASVMVTGVSSFTYTVSSAGGGVTLTLTVSRQSGMKTSTTSFSQRIALRNFVSAS